MDAHNEEIYCGELGFSGERLKKLKEADVILFALFVGASFEP